MKYYFLLVGSVLVNTDLVTTSDAMQKAFFRERGIDKVAGRFETKEEALAALDRAKYIAKDIWDLDEKYAVREVYYVVHTTDAAIRKAGGRRALISILEIVDGYFQIPSWDIEFGKIWQDD